VTAGIEVDPSKYTPTETLPASLVNVADSYAVAMMTGAVDDADSILNRYRGEVTSDENAPSVVDPSSSPRRDLLMPLGHLCHDGASAGSLATELALHPAPTVTSLLLLPLTGGSTIRDAPLAVSIVGRQCEEEDGTTDETAIGDEEDDGFLAGGGRSVGGHAWSLPSVVDPTSGCPLRRKGSVVPSFSCRPDRTPQSLQVGLWRCPCGSGARFPSCCGRPSAIASLSLTPQQLRVTFSSSTATLPMVVGDVVRPGPKARRFGQPVASGTSNASSERCVCGSKVPFERCCKPFAKLPPIQQELVVAPTRGPLDDAFSMPQPLSGARAPSALPGHLGSVSEAAVQLAVANRAVSEVDTRAALMTSLSLATASDLLDGALRGPLAAALLSATPITDLLHLTQTMFDVDLVSGVMLSLSQRMLDLSTSGSVMSTLQVVANHAAAVAASPPSLCLTAAVVAAVDNGFLLHQQLQVGDRVVVDTAKSAPLASEGFAWVRRVSARTAARSELPSIYPVARPPAGWHTRISVRHVTGSIEEMQDEPRIINLFTGVAAPGGATGAVDRQWSGGVSGAIRRRGIQGRLGEVHVLREPNASSEGLGVVAVTGLGPSSTFAPEHGRVASAAAVSAILDAVVATPDATSNATAPLRIHTIMHGSGIGGHSPTACAHATLLGALDGIGSSSSLTAALGRWAGIELVLVEFDERRSAAAADGVRKVQEVLASIDAGLVAPRDVERAAAPPEGKRKGKVVPPRCNGDDRDDKTDVTVDEDGGIYPLTWLRLDVQDVFVPVCPGCGDGGDGNDEIETDEDATASLLLALRALPAALVRIECRRCGRKVDREDVDERGMVILPARQEEQTLLNEDAPATAVDAALQKPAPLVVPVASPPAVEVEALPEEGVVAPPPPPPPPLPSPPPPTSSVPPPPPPPPPLPKLKPGLISPAMSRPVVEVPPRQASPPVGSQQARSSPRPPSLSPEESLYTRLAAALAPRSLVDTLPEGSSSSADSFSVSPSYVGLLLPTLCRDVRFVGSREDKHVEKRRAMLTNEGRGDEVARERAGECLVCVSSLLKRMAVLPQRAVAAAAGDKAARLSREDALGAVCAHGKLLLTSSLPESLSSTEMSNSSSSTLSRASLALSPKSAGLRYLAQDRTLTSLGSDDIDKIYAALDKRERGALKAKSTEENEVKESEQPADYSMSSVPSSVAGATAVGTRLVWVPCALAHLLSLPTLLAATECPDCSQLIRDREQERQVYNSLVSAVQQAKANATPMLSGRPVWYMVEGKWFRSWQRYIRPPTELFAPNGPEKTDLPPIRTSLLRNTDPSNTIPEKVAAGLRVDEEYVAVPRNVWTYLRAKYGVEGPTIARYSRNIYGEMA